MPGVTLREIREAVKAQPFRPFVLRCASGQQIAIPHPEFVAVPQVGRSISVVLPSGSFKILDVRLIESLDFDGPARGRRRAAG